MDIFNLTKEQQNIRSLIFSKEKGSRDLGWQLDESHNNSKFKTLLPYYHKHWGRYYDMVRILVENYAGVDSVRESINYIHLSPYVTHVDLDLGKGRSVNQNFDIKLPKKITHLTISHDTLSVGNPKKLLEGLENLEEFHNYSKIPVELHEENINRNLILSFLNSKCIPNKLEVLENKEIGSLNITSPYHKAKISSKLKQIIPTIKTTTFETNIESIIQNNLFPIDVKYLNLSGLYVYTLHDKVVELKELIGLKINASILNIDFNKFIKSNIEELSISKSCKTEIPIEKLIGSKVKKIFIGKSLLDLSKLNK